MSFIVKNKLIYLKTIKILTVSQNTFLLLTEFKKYV